MTNAEEIAEIHVRLSLLDKRLGVVESELASMLDDSPVARLKEYEKNLAAPPPSREERAKWIAKDYVEPKYRELLIADLLSFASSVDREATEAERERCLKICRSRQEWRFIVDHIRSPQSQEAKQP